MTAIATTCAELTLSSARPRKGTVNSTCSSPTPGTKKPSVLAKASATAATKPVLMARRSVHPYRKPKRGENASERKTYCPPARGMAAASSAYESAPARVSRPPRTHSPRSRPGLCR